MVDDQQLEIKFPVAVRYLRDSKMPDTMRWYPEYAWAIMGPDTTVMGCAGVFNFGWFTELGSLWVDETIRGPGWGRQLTAARINFLQDHQYYPDKKRKCPDLVISRPRNQVSRHILTSVGFKPSYIDDGAGDFIYYAYLKGL